jgi:YVTN family beta-propeller protein
MRVFSTPLVPALCALVCAASWLETGATAQANLLRNPGAQAGAASAHGWDSVTIPGWTVVSGLPTVVGYATKGFAHGRRGGQLFAGGPGGTARLNQRVTFQRRDGAPVVGAPYTFSARLGGSSSSRASASVTFLSARGRRLGRRSLPGVGGPGRSSASRLRRRSLHGRVPDGAVGAEVTLRLATSLTNVDGPYSPKVGYDRAVADDLRFDLPGALSTPHALRPPVAQVPRYQHVFLFYFENQDVRAIVGDRRRAPYYNRLLSQGSELGQMYAEEHPSDGNYLALAGGSTFGIPLTDPLEVSSQYTIHAVNIGDRIDAAGETWKDYQQSSAGPCDDTVHGFYWDDDLPMLYFADIRDRPTYCAAHDVPLASMASDLSRPETTPNFSWVGVNDCDDMEGCGVRAGDRFLAKELGEIMDSPAWQAQRSLAIITFDEDAVDHERPAQRIPTLMLASTGVRHGYVSKVRYTHYSLLRTIEAALGLKTLTRNDRFAQPVNDVFRRGATTAQAPPSPYHASAPASESMPSSSSAATPSPPPPGPATAFVVSSQAGTVTPVELTNRRAERPIAVGRAPQAIALSPDQRMAYVVNSGSDTVTPIQTGPRRREPAIAVGHDPQAIAITPNGRTAFVSDAGSDTVTPIDLRSDVTGPPIPVGLGPRRLAIAPDGRTLYVLDWGGHTVTPIDVRTERALAPIRVGSYPSSIVIDRSGRRAYVANYGSNTVTPITTSDRRPGPPIRVGQAPSALALSPNGARLLVVDGDTDRLTTIATRSSRQIHSTSVGISPEAITLSRSGATAYVVNTISGTITPVDVASGHADAPISVGTYAYPTQIIPASDGDAVVLGTYAGNVRVLDTGARSASRPIKVGALPIAAAITR